MCIDKIMDNHLKQINKLCNGMESDRLVSICFQPVQMRTFQRQMFPNYRQVETMEGLSYSVTQSWKVNNGCCGVVTVILNFGANMNVNMNVIKYVNVSVNVKMSMRMLISISA